MNKSQKLRDLEMLSSLTRILKSGLYAVLEIIYVFWVGATFSLSGWLSGLLAILCIAAVHPLRWLWDESSNVDVNKDTDPRVAYFKKKLEYGFAAASIVCDIILIALVVFTLHGWYWIVGIAVSVIATEYIHLKIRSVSNGLVQLRTDIRKEYDVPVDKICPAIPNGSVMPDETCDPVKPATISVILDTPASS